VHSGWARLARAGNEIIGAERLYTDKWDYLESVNESGVRNIRNLKITIFVKKLWVISKLVSKSNIIRNVINIRFISYYELIGGYVITKVDYRTSENYDGIRFWMSWVTVVTKELMEDIEGYDEAFEDLSETCKNEQMWWKPLVRTVATPPFVVREMIVGKFDQFIKRDKSLLFHKSIKTYESRLHISVFFSWEKLKVDGECLRQEWVIPKYKVWLACIGNTALWLDDDQAEVSRPWDRPEGTFYERLGERFHLVTVDEAGDYAAI
jgi:hypothetical protein